MRSKMIKKKEDEPASAIGCARYAYDYIDAARIVDKEIGRRPEYALVSPMPAYFLAMHGIELTLKAFLASQGVPIHQLGSKTLGHDLKACHRKAKELGLAEIFKTSESDETAMSLLVALNKNQGLRYIWTGEKEFPSWAIVAPLAVRLHQAVAPVVGYKTFTVYYVQDQ
jgi:hypothetical protein